MKKTRGRHQRKETLDRIGEDEILSRIRRLVPPSGTGTVVGIGDDAAVLRPPRGEMTVATTDSLVEGVHFAGKRLDWRGLGYKTVLANAADIVAMGGTPTYGLLSLALPGSTAWEDIAAFYAGLLEALDITGAELAGGDVDRFERIVINFTMIGKVRARRILRQNGALPGQTIYVTGTLGDSAAALPILAEKRKRRLSPEEETILHRHFHPPYLHREMEEIRRIWKPTATTDLSDGLARDLRKICTASNVGASVDLEGLPISVECFLVSEKRDQDPRLLAATGGEDYQLLFTSDRPAEKSPTEAGGVAVSPVGRINRSPKKIRYRLCGRAVEVKGGFDHFSQGKLE